MKKGMFLLLAVLTASLAFSSSVFAFGGCEENCQKCHTLDNAEARQILQKINAPAAEVLDIKMSPVGGLWEVAVENEGKKGVLYVSFSKKFIMGGAIYEVETSLNKTHETLSKLSVERERFVEYGMIPLEHSLIMGDKNAEHKVFIFTDPDCPFCGKLHGELKKVIAERREIAFFLKLMPLRMHPDAYWKSQSVLCRQSLELLEDNFAGKAIPKPDCETKGIDENMRLGAELGITGTPTMVLPDGLVIAGTREAVAIIEMVLKGREKGAKQ